MANGQWTQARRYAVKKWNITTELCQLCNECKGTQKHRRRCRVTTPKEGWQDMPQKARLAWNRIGAKRQELLENTGLLTVKVPKLEPVGKDTFKWYSQPPDTTRRDLVWVIDGSALNSRWSALATYGFGIVVYTTEGDLIAWGCGIPPAWTDSASAAEAWALAVVTSNALHPPMVITDCLGLLHTAEAGTAAATCGKRQLARTWAVIANNLDGDISQLTRERRLCWMPAHQGIGAIGVATKSNGKTITSLEWRANRLVDAVAKNESAKGQAPQTSIDLIVSATALVQHTAAQIGAATHLANNHVTSILLESGAIVNKTVRDVQDPPAKKRTLPAKPQVVKEKVEPAAAESSDWDSEDERQAYGPNTKRSRKAARKKERCLAEAAVLRDLVKSIQTERKRAEGTTRKDRGSLLEAANALTTAAKLGDNEKSTSSTPNKVQAPPVSSSLTGTDVGQAKEDHSSRGSHWTAAASSRASRERPKKKVTKTSASADAAALLSLLKR